MSWVSRFFNKSKSASSKTPAAAQVEMYNGYRITPAPMDENGQYRLAARIERDTDEGTKTHQLIRSDLILDRQEAEAASLRKAKLLIDQMGMALFD